MGVFTLFLKKLPVKYLILVMLPLIAFIVALPLGRYPISLPQLLAVMSAKFLGWPANVPDSMYTVIFQVRLPRIFAALLIGAALAVSGTAYQGIFRNPLVSPDILGASAGAGFGAALAILLSWGVTGIHISSFLFGLLAVFLTYGVSLKINKSDLNLVLVLAGILIGTVFSSLISLIKYIADPYDKLPAITFWLMDSLSSISLNDVYIVLMPMFIGMIPLYFVRWHLNTLAFGDEEAQALGIDTGRLRFLVIFCSTLITASAVAISGMIGWVGLLIPHFSRAIVGPNYRYLLLTAVFLGSSYLLVVDTLARILFPMEIPLGILTSLMGAPFFVYLLTRSGRGWK